MYCHNLYLNLNQVFLRILWWNCYPNNQWKTSVRAVLVWIKMGIAHSNGEQIKVWEGAFYYWKYINTWNYIKQINNWNFYYFLFISSTMPYKSINIMSLISNLFNPSIKCTWSNTSFLAPWRDRESTFKQVLVKTFALTNNVMPYFSSKFFVTNNLKIFQSNYLISSRYFILHLQMTHTQKTLDGSDLSKNHHANYSL